MQETKNGNFKAARDYNLNLENTIYIGDDIRDEQAAMNSGCTSLRLSTKEDSNSIRKSKRGIYKTLRDAVDDLIIWDELRHEMEMHDNTET